MIQLKLDFKYNDRVSLSKGIKLRYSTVKKIYKMIHSSYGRISHIDGERKFEFYQALNDIELIHEELERACVEHYKSNNDGTESLYIKELEMIIHHIENSVPMKKEPVLITY